jgi:hypothetical protein
VNSASQARQPIRVVYAATRGEILRWYARSWVTPSPFWGMRLITLGSLTVFVALAVRAHHSSIAAGVGTWALCVLAYVAFVFLYPQVRYRRRERTLEISPEGVESWAGELHSRTAWRKTRGLGRMGREALLIRTGGGVYVIPRRAFASDAEMDRFYDAAVRWSEAARS